MTAYDNQLRPEIPDPVPAGVTVERDGPLVRISGLDAGGFITYRDLGGLTGDALDELIARQVRLCRERGESAEWKLNEHDEPADLADRLRAAGFVPEDRETVVVGPVAPLAAALPVVPEGVRLREVTSREDLERIAAMEEEVWQEDRSHLVWGLAKEIDADPNSITVVVAEADETVVSAGWVRFPANTGFATPVGRLDPAAVAAQGHLPGAGQLPGAAGRAAGPDAACRSTAPRTAGRSCSGSASSRSPPPPRTSTLRDHGAAVDGRGAADPQDRCLRRRLPGLQRRPGVLGVIRESIAASGALADASGTVKEALTTGPLPRLPRDSQLEIESVVLPALGQAVRILREKSPRTWTRTANWC